MISMRNVYHKRCFTCKECERPMDQFIACDAPDGEKQNRFHFILVVFSPYLIIFFNQSMYYFVVHQYIPSILYNPINNYDLSEYLSEKCRHFLCPSVSLCRQFLCPSVSLCRQFLCPSVSLSKMMQTVSVSVCLPIKKFQCLLSVLL